MFFKIVKNKQGMPVKQTRIVRIVPSYYNHFILRGNFSGGMGKIGK